MTKVGSALVALNVADDVVAAFDTVSQELAKVATVKEAKAVADEWQALRVYHQRVKSGLEAQNRCVLVKITAERRAGQLLAAMPQAPVGGAQSGRGEKHSHTKGECLADLSIHWEVAARWERLAQVPDDAWEKWSAHVLSGKVEGELSSAGVDRETRLMIRRREIAQDPDWTAKLYAKEVYQAANRLLKDAWHFMEPGRQRDNDLTLVLEETQEIVDFGTLEKLCAAFVEVRFRSSFAVEALRKRLHGEQVKWLSRTSEVERLVDADVLKEVVTTT